MAVTAGESARSDVDAVLDCLPDLDERSCWTVIIRDGRETEKRVHESLLALGDGVSGTRGSLEEDGPGSRPGLFMAGIYDTSAEARQALVVLPSWARLALLGHVPAGVRILDMRTGVLWRATHVDGTTRLRTARWSCLARPGTSVLLADGDPELLAPVPAHEVIDVPTSIGGGVRGIVDTTCDERHGEVSPTGARVVTVASFVANGDRIPSKEGMAARHQLACRVGPAVLFEEQRDAWESRWDAADVEVVGDAELTRAIRFALFHLAGSVSDHAEAAVGARGLSGSAYAGHVFWDADVFVLPVLAATHPTSAQAMLEYRIRRLPAATRAAASLGRSGARFPWESAHDGIDVTPRSGVDERGQVVPIRTGGLEEHITADVAWAAWHVAAWTGSWSHLEGRGRGLLVETARYWESRVRLDAEGKRHIDGVIGPDEYHEDVNDNAFTNIMAAWNLRRASELVERIDGRIDNPEVRRWRTIADSLVDGYDPATGRHQQFAGFDQLEPLLATDLGPPPVAADVVLGHQRLAQSQVVKQADVLMAHYLVPGSMPPGTLQADMDHYLPRTAHGSSLSPAIHAGLLARLGRMSEALTMLDLARGIDLDDLTGTTAAGLHLAALGGLWQAVVYGFAGLRVDHPDDTTLHLDPHIPEDWVELRLRIRWRGRLVKLRCASTRVHVECEAPLQVQVGTKRPTQVAAGGQWIETGREEYTS